MAWTTVARLSRGVLPLFLLASFLLACSAGDAGSEAVTLRLVGAEDVRLTVEVADTPAELARGLAGRDRLAPDAGMLFIIERRGRGFWMKDVAFPLAVAFIGECGEIVAIADMEPHSLQLHDTVRPYRFGLEVNRGWFAAHAVAVGDVVTVPEQLRRPGCP